MKKIVSILLAVFVLAAFACPALTMAAGAPAFEVSSASVEAGEEFEVTIMLKNNPGIISAKLAVAFDSDFTLKSVAFGEKLGGNSQQPQKLDSPVTLNWISPTAELKSDEVFATLTFTASKTAKDGEHKIETSYNPNDVFNMAEKNIDFSAGSGTVKVTGGVSESDTSSAVTNDTTTTGATENHDDGNGDYIGEEVLIEEEENEGETAEATGTATEKETTPLWVFAVMAAFFIVAAVVIVVLKKRADKKNADAEE